VCAFPFATRHMNTKTGGRLRVSVLAFCAYGLGLLFGLQVNRMVHRPAAAESHATYAANELTAQAPESPSADSGEAAADLSAFLPGRSTAFQLFEAKLRELERSSEMEWSSQLRQLIPLLFGLGTDDFPNAWFLVRDLRCAEWQREDSKRYKVGAWSERNPRGALAAVLASSENRLIDEALKAWRNADGGHQACSGILGSYRSRRRRNLEHNAPPWPNPVRGPGDGRRELGRSGSPGCCPVAPKRSTRSTGLAPANQPPGGTEDSVNPEIETRALSLPKPLRKCSFVASAESLCFTKPRGSPLRNFDYVRILACILHNTCADLILWLQERVVLRLIQ
jgi:hypothetical protein